MNHSENKETLDGEASRNSEESSSSSLTLTTESNTTTENFLTEEFPEIQTKTEKQISTQLSAERNKISGDTNSDGSNNLEQKNTFKLTNIIEGEPNSSTVFKESNNCDNSEIEEMKRSAAKDLIERYFFQLLDGCGNVKCDNKYCASSGNLEKLSPNQAAARALQLFTMEAKLCNTQPSKIARTNESLGASSSKQGECSSKEIPLGTSSSSHITRPSSQTLKCRNDASSSSVSSQNQISSPSNSSHSKILDKYTKITYLNEEKIDKLIMECRLENSFIKLIRTIGEVFSSAELISKSFRKKPKTKIDEMLRKAPKDLKSLKKEDLRTLEGDLDKDEDSSAKHDDNLTEEIEYCGTDNTNVDILSLRSAMKKLFKIHTECTIYESLNNALHSLSILLGVDLRMSKDRQWIESTINIFVIVFEVMTIASSEFLENALPNICRAAARLPVWAQAKLATIWAEHCKDSLKDLLQALQQIISLQVIIGQFSATQKVEDVEVIQNVTKVLKIVYYANILAGMVETAQSDQLQGPLQSQTNVISSEEDDFYVYSQLQKTQTSKRLLEDELEKELGITHMNSRAPFIPFEEFYNEPLSDIIEMDYDYLNYKNYTMELTSNFEKKFTFMLYSFILTPATKVLGLYYDSRIRMYSERRSTYINNHLQYFNENGAGPNPYLKLKIRRDQLIDDALIELEMIAMGTPKDFKKQLVVEFVDEQGIDEGGVSKEFFQLIIEEIFNPDFGMFIYQEDNKTVWFNSNSFENEAQFTLIGIVLGLAIYNNIILAVHFPMVVYRKLMGYHGTFHDLADWNPTIYKSLKSLLDYTENDMEEVFMQTFKISYTDIFGNPIEYELKSNGGEIFVNQDNKNEFIELYSDYLLNKSIDKQFKAFKKGFEMVTDESPLKLLFRPEEIELLVCGSKNFDFVELEKSTEYEGGYTEKSQIIIDFWSIVHDLPMESKKKLLEFTTGSDRVPVGGLSKLKLVIARHGPDSDRLPTSHTCFNVLLLPEYGSRQKLEDRLLKAINYSKGFGML